MPLIRPKKRWFQIGFKQIKKIVPKGVKIQKKSFRSITKMTLTDELKILNDKIKANQAQYDLDREAAKISALSSKELDKYEYLTGEDQDISQE